METISLTILKATSGHKLLNREQQLIAVEVQLAPKANASDWEEITDAEAESLQAEWEAAIDAERNAEAVPNQATE